MLIAEQGLQRTMEALVSSEVMTVFKVLLYSTSEMWKSIKFCSYLAEGK